MANRFTQYSRQRYYELPVDYYQQALGVNEARTNQQVSDLAQNVQFIKNMPAVGGPDKLRLQQLLDNIESGISGIAKKDLSAADTLNELNTLISDRTLNNDAVGIYQNVLGYKKKMKEIEDYEKKFGNTVNTTRLKHELNRYLSQQDAGQFKAGFFENLSAPVDYVDVKGKIGEFVSKLKANKQTVEYENGRWITKESKEGLSESELYEKAYQMFADDPSYSNQFRENAYYDAYQSGQGDATQGYINISDNYARSLQNEIDRLADLRASGKVTGQNLNLLQGKINSLIGQRDQVSKALVDGNYQQVALYKTRDDLIRNASTPFAWENTSQEIKVNPYALAEFKAGLEWSMWGKKMAMLNAPTPVTPLTVAEGLAPDQVVTLANDEIKKAFGGDVELNETGTGFDLSDRSVGSGFKMDTGAYKAYAEAEIRLRKAYEQRYGLTFKYSKEGQDAFAKEVQALKVKHGIVPAAKVTNLKAIQEKLRQLAVSNPELKKFLDRGDYVSAFKHYRGALEQNLKMNESYVISNATGYNPKLLPSLLAGIGNSPVSIITPDGGYKDVTGLNGVLAELGALTGTSSDKGVSGKTVQDMVFSPANILSLQKATGMLTTQISTPTGVYKIVFAPPKNIISQFDGLNAANLSGKQGRLNISGSTMYVVPKIEGGKMQKTIFAPMTPAEQIPGSVNYTKTRTFRDVTSFFSQVSKNPTQAKEMALKVFQDIVKFGKGSDTFLINGKTGKPVSVGEAQSNPEGHYFGITVHSENGIRTLQLSKPAGFDMNQLYDFQFNQLNQPGGGLYNFRQTHKTKMGTMATPLIDNELSNSSFLESDDE